MRSGESPSIPNFMVLISFVRFVCLFSFILPYLAARFNRFSAQTFPANRTTCCIRMALRRGCAEKFSTDESNFGQCGTKNARHRPKVGICFATELGGRPNQRGMVRRGPKCDRSECAECLQILHMNFQLDFSLWCYSCRQEQCRNLRRGFGRTSAAAPKGQRRRNRRRGLPNNAGCEMTTI